MPGKIKVKILAGRNLPVMDRSGDTTDAYVELKFSNITYKTDVCRKSLNPQWNSEWYRFEVDDAELQDEPLQIRLMDHDTYSANDAIGKVYINLNPLLLPGMLPPVKNIWTLEAAMNTTTGSQGSVMTGWIPVYDTMHGIRGEVNIIVKVELFSDFNKFRQSSCGVQFFYSPNIPYGYHAQMIHGFVEELVVNDDPEYKWIDKIRTPRASNEARQTLFFKLSGEVQRKIGLKALDLGGNAVIGYLQNFDLEGESGIVARGIGTAVTLVKLHDTLGFPCDSANIEEITFALSSRTKTRNVQAECFGIDDNDDDGDDDDNDEDEEEDDDDDDNDDDDDDDDDEPLIPLPAHVPASYPPRISTQSADKGLPSYSASSASLITRLEHDTGLTEARRYGRTRRRYARCIPLLRSATSTGIPSLRVSSRPDLPDYLSPVRLIGGGTPRSRCIITPRSCNTRKEPSRYRLFERIKYLRDRFDSVGEEEQSHRPPDSDADSVSWCATNLRQQKRPKEAKTAGNMMAALLIGSVHSMPLEISADPASSGNEYIEMKDLARERTVCSGENSRENLTDMTDNSDMNGEQAGAAPPSSPDGTERSSSCENNDSAGDDLSDDVVSYRILDDSRYQLNGDRDQTEDSSSLPVRIAASSVAEASTDLCMPQINSDLTMDRLGSSLDTTSTKDYVKLRKDDTVVPVITADARESSKRDVSTSCATVTDIPVSESSCSSLADKRGKANDAKRSAGLSFVDLRMPYLDTRADRRCNDVTPAAPDDSSRQVHRVHLTRHERNLCRTRSESAQRNGQPAEETEENPAGEKRKDSAIRALGDASPCTTTDTSVLNEELRARTSGERRRCMHDLIKLIDTKMMIPAMAHATRHARRAASQLSKRRKREKETCQVATSGKLAKRSTSRGTSVKRHASHRHRTEKETPLRVVPRVRSHPDSICSFGQVYTTRTRSLRAISRSCGSSLVDLTDHRTRAYSLGSRRRAVVLPAPAIDRPSDGGWPVDSRASPKSNRTSKLAGTAPSAVPVGIRSLDTGRPTCPSSCVDATSSVIITVRKCSSVCNLEEASCHIDCTKLSTTNTSNMTHNTCVSRPSPDLRQQDEASISPSYPLPAVASMAVKMSQSPATRTLASVPLHRRSSDSDLSVTPKGNSLGSSDRSMAGLLRTPAAVVRPMNQDTLEMLEYPFITMQHYPPGFVLHIGGLVSSRSVKLLERISNLEEPEGRDAWWTEIRMEVRSHARALACNVVIGYKEETSICEDVCVLSASGTAAIINLHNPGQDSDGVVLNKLQQLQLQQGMSATTVDAEKGREQKTAVTRTEKMDGDVPVAIHSERQNGKACRHSSESNDHESSGQPQLRCNLCHLPYSDSSVPFRVNVSKCAICKRAKVPDVMFTTIEVPTNIPTTGRGCFIQATVCKNKKDLRGELNAKEISDCLPFLEYELHSLLLNKLKIKGMNAIFGLKLQVSVGERFIIGMAMGTAVYLTALPPPTIPQIASGNSWHNEEQLAEMQKSIVETVKKNREFYHLKLQIGINEMENGRIVNTSDTDESDEDLPELELGLGTRDACVLEVDDIEDMDRISSLMDDRPPDDFHVVNTQTIPGLEDLEIVRNLQMFTQVWRAKIPTGQAVSTPSKYLARLLQSLYFKLRRMVPCALCDMQFKVALPEQDEIQLTVIGMALGLGEPLNADKYKRKIVYRSLSKDQVRKSDDNDMIFSLDEDHLENNAASDNATRITCTSNPATLTSFVPVQKPRPRSPLRSKIFTTHRRKHMPLKGRYGVDITPLSYLPGGRIERYQGNLNFFFIRESTSIRENGGLSGFTHSFVMEVLAIVRAHITALGGNAMVAFFMTQCVLLHSPHKNQGQCLINVGGDVVTVSYYADEKHGAVSNC